MADKICSDDGEKSIYLIQIQYLDEQLERCQLKCDELEKQNKDLISQYSMLEKDKRDITEYLKRSVAAKEKKVDELAEQLESQQQAAEQDTEALKLQHSRQIQELQDRVVELNSESMMNVAKFEEQQEHKEQLMWQMQQLSDMESLKKKLVSQKEEREAAIESLKKEAALERKKMIDQVQKSVDNCVKMKTSNILQEERAQHSERAEQLQFLLKESLNLRKEIDDLQDRRSDIHVERDDLEKDVYKTSLKSFTCKKEVEQLRVKCQELKVELKDCNITLQHLLAQKEALSQLLASVSEESRQNTVKAVQLGAELQGVRSRRRQLEGCVQEAVIILRHVLTGSEKESETQRKMQRLLEVLESTAVPPREQAPSAEDRHHRPRTPNQPEQRP